MSSETSSQHSPVPSSIPPTHSVCVKSVVCGEVKTSGHSASYRLLRIDLETQKFGNHLERLTLGVSMAMVI